MQLSWQAFAILIFFASSTWAEPPNIIMVLTDDQDVHMRSVEHMQYVQQHLVQKGTTFTKHYCTTAVCCPSRVNLFTGQLSHNTNVTDVNPPYGECSCPSRSRSPMLISPTLLGGYPKFIEEGYNDKYVPVLDAGRWL